jgi:hypothetical protein
MSLFNLFFARFALVKAVSQSTALIQRMSTLHYVSVSNNHDVQFETFKNYRNNSIKAKNKDDEFRRVEQAISNNRRN